MSTIPFERSFASHPKAQYWSDKNEISPRECYKSICEKFWFNCECGHIFYSSLNSISSKKYKLII